MDQSSIACESKTVRFEFWQQLPAHMANTRVKQKQQSKSEYEACALASINDENENVDQVFDLFRQMCIKMVPHQYIPRLVDIIFMVRCRGDLNFMRIKEVGDLRVFFKFLHLLCNSNGILSVILPTVEVCSYPYISPQIISTTSFFDKDMTIVFSPSSPSKNNAQPKLSFMKETETGNEVETIKKDDYKEEEEEEVNEICPKRGSCTNVNCRYFHYSHNHNHNNNMKKILKNKQKHQQIKYKSQNQQQNKSKNSLANSTFNQDINEQRDVPRYCIDFVHNKCFRNNCKYYHNEELKLKLLAPVTSVASEETISTEQMS